MAGELAIEKVHRGTTFKYETIAKMTVKYGKPGETFSQMLERVCEKLTKNVKLTTAQHAEIDAQIVANREKRLAKRAKKK